MRRQLSVYGFLAVALSCVVLTAQQSTQTPQSTASQSATQSATADKTARLEGRVLALDGSPVRKATVWLRPSGGGGGGPFGGQPGGATSYQESSAADGKFLFEDIPPGRYTLSAERNGYVTQIYGARSNANTGTVLNVSAGQGIKDLTFKLIPHGVISGRVTDLDGDPLFGMAVQVLRQQYVNGRRQLMPAGQATTDDLGSFRAPNLAPGRYYVSAQDMRGRMAAGPFNQVRNGRTQMRESNVTTYYPGVVDAAGAAPIDVRAGMEMRGVEIRIRREKVYLIKGIAMDATSNSPVQAGVTIRPKNGVTAFGGPGLIAMAGGFGGGAARAADGSFELRNLLPGTYVLTAFSGRGGGPGGFGGGRGGQANTTASYVGRMEVTISDRDVEGLVFPLSQGAHLTGTIRLEEGDLRQYAASLQSSGQSTNGNVATRINISLVDIDNAGTQGPGQPNTRALDDGTFDLRGVAPSRFLVNMTGLPDGTYAKSIRFNGQDVTRTPLDLTNGGDGGQFDIVLSVHAGEISGTVQNTNGEATGGVMVTLWPKVPMAESPNGEARSATTDQNGAFRFAGLAPRDYVIAAWEEIEQGMNNNPGFLKRFDTFGSGVKIAENSKESVTPKWVTSQKAAEEAARVE